MYHAQKAIIANHNTVIAPNADPQQRCPLASRNSPPASSCLVDFTHLAPTTDGGTILIGLKCELHGVIGVRLKSREDVANLIVALTDAALEVYGVDFTKHDLMQAEKDLIDRERGLRSV